MGDYYRGDFLGIGKFAKGLTHVIPSVLPVAATAASVLPGPAGVIGRVARTVGGFLSKGSTAAASAGAAAGALIASRVKQQAPPGQKPVPGLKGTLERLLPGGKTGYYKRRRMNPTNVRALRRAIRRAKSFEKLARQVIHFSGGRTCGKAKFSFKRKRKCA